MDPTTSEVRPDDPQPEMPPPNEVPPATEPPTEPAPLSAAEAAAADRPGVYWQQPAPEIGSDAAGWRGVGAIVGRTLDTYGSSFGLFLPLAAPVAILGAMSIFAATNVPALLLTAVLTAVVGIVTGGAMMLATDDLWRGVRPSVADVLDRAAGRAVALILSTYVVALIVGVLAVVVAIAGVILGVAAVAGSGSSAGLAVVVLLALGAGVIALYVLLRWALGGPAIAVDGLGPLAGLTRSRALTRGHLWGLVGLYFVLGLISLLASGGASLLSTYAPERAFAAAGLAIATLLTSPLIAIAPAIAYRDLAGRAEGAGERLPRKAGRGPALIAVIGAGMIVFAAGVWSVASAGGQVFLPERGQVVAGTTANAADPCRPGGVKTTFTSGEEIWIAAIFTRRVSAGEEVVVEYYRGDESLGSAPLTAGPVGLECYYETDPIRGAEPGSYRIVVRHGAAAIAEGTFTIR